MTAPTPSQARPSRARRRGGRILLAALFVGLSLLAASPARAATHQVTIQQYAYGPSGLSIQQGDTVTWTNLDTVEHDVYVTSGPDSFHSPMLGKGESWSHTFTTAGSYSYICSVHPDMRASVSVAAAPAAAPTTAAAPTPQSHAGSGRHGAAGAPSAAAIPGTPTPATPTAATGAPTVVAAGPTSALDPLLLVAGASVAVVVFCLLLMASRPAYEVAPQPPAGEQEQRSGPAPEPEPGATANDQTSVDLEVG